MPVFSEDSYLAHYGIIRRSGRYPWGSGDNVVARSMSFMDYIQDFLRRGFSLSDIGKAIGEYSEGSEEMSSTDLRAIKTLARNQIKAAEISQAERLKAKGLSNVEIGKKLGKGESYVRSLLAPGAAAKANSDMKLADMLQRHVDEKGYIDVGEGTESYVNVTEGEVENYVGVSKEKMRVALAILKEKGYPTHTFEHQQVGSNNKTHYKVLGPPGSTQKDAFLNRDQMRQIVEFSDDGGHTYGKIHPPISVNPDRVAVRYGDDGGAEADGMIYVRPGVSDLSLGANHYAQVRVKVGDNHYLKGMAIYKDGLPDGVDIEFNTPKNNTGNKLDAMKPLESSPDYPFGSVVRQILSDQGTPNEKNISAMNIVNESGDWGDWSRNLASQMLAKQDPSFASEQLDKAYDQHKAEFDEIMALTNPTVKNKLLETFADSTDARAVNLKAAAMPRQNWHVIIPVNSLKPNEIYAPGYNDGERVALIRYPHGGTFEIPELTVNNRNREAKRSIGGDSLDVVGIHHTVAQRLSGADFDGDAVVVIPNDSGKVKSSPALERLKNFDPVAAYPAYEGMPKLTDDRKQVLMGQVSNLITDMTLQGASNQDISQAVRHSMVVIDAAKKNLNYKQSEIDHGIRKLKERYQGSARGGASTIFSRTEGPGWTPERKPRPQSEGGPIDRETGEKRFVPTGKTTVNKAGERVIKREKLKRGALTNDAHTLTSGKDIRMENIYADHSNRMRSLANQARLESLKTPPTPWSPSARRAYSKEVASLDSKMALINQNRPRERQAQVVATNAIKAVRASNPDMGKDTLRKVKYREREIARRKMGVMSTRIKIDDNEWKAIQAGAISPSKLKKILAKADMDVVRQHATPRTAVAMPKQNVDRAKQMMARGMTRAEVAEALGVSLSTLDKAVYSGGD